MQPRNLNMHNDLFSSDAKKPKYGQIQDSILSGIQKGEWSPGDKIPSERDLAQMFDASVGTVRNAMQVLVNQGYLTRVQGRGTFVNKSVEHTGSLRYFRFAMDFEDVVQPLTIKCLHKPRLGAFPEISKILGLSPKAKLFEVNRIFRLQQEPLVYVTSYLPQNLFPDLGDVSLQVFHEIPLYLFIESKYSMPTLATKERFSAVSASAEVAKMLNLKPGTPVLKIMMVAITTRNTQYEYQVSYCNTARRQIYRD